MAKRKIILYGAQWCADCRRSKDFLDQKGVEYDYIDIDEDPNAAVEVERINKGLQVIPTIVFPDGEVLVEPSNEELEKALEANRKYIIVHKTKQE